MTRARLACVVAALSVACSSPTPSTDRTPSAPAPEVVARNSAALNAYLDQEFEKELQQSPEWLTSLGRKEHADTLDDRTEAGMETRLQWRRKSVADMKAQFDPATLDDEARTSFDMWAQQLDVQEKQFRFRRQSYIFVNGGDQAGLPNFLINMHAVSEKADAVAYIARLNLMGAALDQDLERARLAAAEDIRQPRFAYDKALRESKSVITGEPFSRGADSPLWADVKAKTAALVKEGKVSDAEAKELQSSAKTALLSSVKPAYERLIAWLTEDRAKTSEQSKGVSALKDGAAFYDAQLSIQTTTDKTANDIHALGLSEVARLHTELEQIKTRVGFSGSLPEFFAFMRTSPKFFLPDTDAGRESYLKTAESYLGRMEMRLPEWFGILPKAKLAVKRVEAFREEPGGAQHYFAGAPDGSRPGTFYAHLSDMKAMPTYELETVAYHEGVPGHHLQVSIAQERTGIAKFRTQYGYTAYQEGWGLYAEWLAKQKGFFTDPYSDFGRINAEMWRAVRLVVDTGIHAKGWTEQQAVEYFAANTSKPDAAIRSEVRRYFVWPGQATCYKIGMMELQRLRAQASSELGDHFDDRAFHDVVLGGGAMPLPVLQARVERWVAHTRSAPTQH
ncbi:MAG: DUF885 domain-containing protein [Vicinamibacterales bacterium]